MNTTTQELSQLKRILPLSEREFRRFHRLWEKATALEVDSRVVAPGELFFAQKGLTHDGHGFIPEVLRKGVVGVLADPSYPLQSPAREKKIVRIPSLLDWAGKLGALFYHCPSLHLRMVGITGTDGKTSTTHLLTQAYHHCGYKSAGIGTLGVYMVDNPRLDIPHQHTPNTTPDPIILQRILYSLLRLKVKVVVMEVSSHGLSLGRVQEIALDSGVWTNLSPEHLDFHSTLENYARTKSRLFELLGHSPKKSKHGVMGMDSFLELSGQKKNLPWIREIMGRIEPHPYPLSFFYRSSQPPAIKNNLKKILSPHLVEKNTTTYSSIPSPSSQEVVIQTGKTLGGKKAIISTELVGQFNAQNLTAAFLEIEHFRHSQIPRPSPKMIKGPTKRSMKNLKNIWRQVKIKGRLEPFPLLSRHHPRKEILQECHLYIDYAHTPQALEKTLNALHSLRTLRDKGKKSSLPSPIICVFGCGGERDPVKREPMGGIACRLADISLITDDNPRREDPQAIRDQVAKGWREASALIPKKRKPQSILEVIPGRREAIRRALEIVPPGGIILLAGKGHEDYQIIGTKRFPFDERTVLAELLTDSQISGV